MKTGLREKESAIEIEKREKPVKKYAQSLLNSAGITSLSLASLLMSHLGYLAVLIYANWSLQPM